MRLAKDIWRCAIVPVDLATILARGTLDGLPLHWLPAPGDLRYLADPFGHWRGGRLHVFVEAFDYRTAIGTIEVLVYDAAYRLIERHAALAEPWHLSYPIVFEAEGETWLLPEAHRSGKLTLYRAVDYPRTWAPECVIALDHVPIDATPVYHDGRWWLFYTSADRPDHHMSHLHVAHAERITGPWTPHPGNPVRIDAAGARPGGTPVLVDGVLVVPVQDCARTYGGAIRTLRIETLTPDAFVAHLAGCLTAPGIAAPFDEGLHTLSAAGPATLIDVKRRLVSAKGLAMRPTRDLRRLFGRP